MNRKEIIGRGTALALVLSVVATPALAEGEVNILTWEGYADQSFVA